MGASLRIAELLVLCVCEVWWVLGGGSRFLLVVAWCALGCPCVEISSSAADKLFFPAPFQVKQIYRK